MLQKTITNRTIFCRDNLDILQEINSDSIDLIYIDPPFNKKKIFTAPIGSSAEGASFKDYFREEDVKDEWVQSIKEDNDKLYSFLESVKILEGGKSYNFCYLTYIAVRVIECHRILKETGSLYFHCDPTMSHYLKILLDILFGEKNFRNEIIWKRKSGTGSPRVIGSAHDTILRYAKKTSLDKYHTQYVEYERDYIQSSYNKKTPDGRLYRLHDVVANPALGGHSPRYTYKGFTPETRWLINKEELERLDKEGRLEFSNTGRPYRRLYLDEMEGMPISDTWIDINIASGKESVKYPTQKPLTLLERIIKASSNPGDIVLDPFCGCATTCVAAEKLDRKWIGIDVSQMAYELVKQRLEKEVADPENLLQYQNQIHFTITPPRRNDTDKEPGEEKYIYVISNKKYKNEYKVGIAGNLQSRLNSYQTADPNRGYKLEFSLLVSNYRELEKFIHDSFESRHEWVRGELKEIIEMIKTHKNK